MGIFPKFGGENKQHLKPPPGPSQDSDGSQPIRRCQTNYSKVILRRERLAACRSEPAMEENKKSTKFQHKGDEQKKWADFYANQFCLVKMQLFSFITLSEFHQDVRGWNEGIQCGVFSRWAADKMLRSMSIIPTGSQYRKIGPINIYLYELTTFGDVSKSGNTTIIYLGNHS